MEVDSGRSPPASLKVALRRERNRQSAALWRQRQQQKLEEVDASNAELRAYSVSLEQRCVVCNALCGHVSRLRLR